MSKQTRKFSYRVMTDPSASGLWQVFKYEFGKRTNHEVVASGMNRYVANKMAERLNRTQAA